MKRIIAKAVFVMGMIILAPFGIIAALSSGICSLIWCWIDIIRERFK